jgi:hypothetical protein
MLKCHKDKELKKNTSEVQYLDDFLPIINLTNNEKFF